MKMLKVSEIIDAMIRNYYGTLVCDYSKTVQESTPELYFAPDCVRAAVWNVINRFRDKTKSTLEVYYEAAKYARSTGN